jgi:hypothetical protein
MTQQEIKRGKGKDNKLTDTSFEEKIIEFPQLEILEFLTC